MPAQGPWLQIIRSGCTVILPALGRVSLRQAGARLLPLQSLWRSSRTNKGSRGPVGSPPGALGQCPCVGWGDPAGGGR